MCKTSLEIKLCEILNLSSLCAFLCFHFIELFNRNKKVDYDNLIISTNFRQYLKILFLQPKYVDILTFDICIISFLLGNFSRSGASRALMHFILNSEVKPFYQAWAMCLEVLNCVVIIKFI